MSGKERGKKREEEEKRGEKAASTVGKKGGKRRQRDKERQRVIGSRAADIPVSLTSAPGETTFINPEPSSDFMVTLEYNAHNTLPPRHRA